MRTWFKLKVGKESSLVFISLFVLTPFFASFLMNLEREKKMLAWKIHLKKKVITRDSPELVAAMEKNLHNYHRDTNLHK